MKLTAIYRQPAWVWKQEVAVKGFLLRFYVRRLLLTLLDAVPHPSRRQHVPSKVFPRRRRRLLNGSGAG